MNFTIQNKQKVIISFNEMLLCISICTSVQTQAYTQICITIFPPKKLTIIGDKQKLGQTAQSLPIG